MQSIPRSRSGFMTVLFASAVGKSAHGTLSVQREKWLAQGDRMAGFVTADRNTACLLPRSMEDWLNDHHLARFIVAVVDQLDLSDCTRQYAGRGSAAHHPATLRAVLVYGCAASIFSSRRLERATCDSVALRVIAAGTHPDHDTLATFRRRFTGELQALFVQKLELARERKMPKLGTVCLDGTKIHANASRRSALSHGHIERLEVRLKAEVAELFALVESADQANVPDGVSLHQEIKRREDRLKGSAARTRIAARAAEHHKRETRGNWSLVCMAWNLKRMAVLRPTFG